MNISMHTPSSIDTMLIKALRVQLGMSQIDLAYMANISLPTIYAIESGRQKHPRLDTLNAIARVLNINTAQLLKTENEHPHNSALATRIIADRI